MEWIKCSEKLPTEPGRYLAWVAYDDTGHAMTVGYEEGWNCLSLFGVVDREHEMTNITHWMPLPEPPKEES
jgi:hypothetical protein